MVSVSAKCCHRLPRCLLFTWSDKLLVHSHYRGCTRAVYLCMGLCHCHSHSHASYLLIVRSHTRLSVPSLPNLHPLLLWTHSVISHYLSLLHLFSVLSSLSHLLTQKKPRWKRRRCSKSFGRCRNIWCHKRRPSATWGSSQPVHSQRGQVHAVEEGGCISASSHLFPPIDACKCQFCSLSEDRFSASNPYM